MMDATKQGWVDKTHEAILSVERYLGIKGDSDRVRDFSTLANWIYGAEANPHAFMPSGWESVKDSAQSFAAFLQTLHHSMLDDGSLIFLEVQGGPSFMILNVDDDNTATIQEIFEKRSSWPYDRPYEVHHDVARFIKQSNWYGNKGTVTQADPEVETA
jgi:hypothetical protein